MATVAEALREAAVRLAATSDSARLDAELLMAQALGVSRSDLLLRHQQDVAPSSYGVLIERRERHEPVAYIVGTKEFYGRAFVVGPDVLIPRMDSETTVAAALEACPRPRRVLDCGVGSGALLITAVAETGGGGVGIDRSQEALAIAARNAKAHNCSVMLLRRDWREPGWADDLGQFDLILANPPYIEDDAQLGPDVRDWEPAGALYAGPDGLDDYLILVPQLTGLLTESGIAVLEIGSTQAEQVAEIAAKAGFSSEMRCDLADRPRALILRLRLGK
jgi:release factor glutamine methyltransferase